MSTRIFSRCVAPVALRYGQPTSRFQPRRGTHKQILASENMLTDAISLTIRDEDEARFLVLKDCAPIVRVSA